MKKILIGISILGSLSFSGATFAEDDDKKVCKVNVKKTKTYEADLKKCAKDDILSIAFKAGGIEMFAFTNAVARACVMDTVRVSNLGGLCIYRGSLRTVRTE
jgi:hypothetical protein|tara:strand:- start:1027 stop:1332 length:306 start_codon:yes stop_codon:yes gene_type:complete